MEVLKNEGKTTINWKKPPIVTAQAEGIITNLSLNITADKIKAKLKYKTK